jgi:hypothetical protein
VGSEKDVPEGGAEEPLIDLLGSGEAVDRVLPGRVGNPARPGFQLLSEFARHREHPQVAGGAFRQVTRPRRARP